MIAAGEPRRIRWAATLAVVLGLCVLLHRTEWPGVPQSPQTATRPRGFESAVLSVASAHDSANANAAIAKLRRLIAACPKAEAILAIRDFLDTGRDAPTGLAFALNADGSLRQAPTLRTLLLDMLAKMAPDQASQVAQHILENKTSPDEWAISLAIYARSDSSDAATAFLQQKAEEMALNQAWQQSPSSGFLEAFDVFVYTHDTAFVPDLSQMAANADNPALAHAAFLALDRLVQSDPIPTLQTLLDDPDLMAGRLATQAAYFARADARDPEQRQLLSQYLLSPNRSLPELEAFAGLFPNENFLVSYNLLTQTQPVTNQEVVSRYDAAWQLIGQWQADSQFEALRPQLNQMAGRLARIRGG
jgi:hypothetical protein